MALQCTAPRTVNGPNRECVNRSSDQTKLKRMRERNETINSQTHGMRWGFRGAKKA